MSKRIPSPTASLPSVDSAEPFTFAGKSYISFVVATANGSNKNAEVWIASLAPTDDFIRRVSPTGTNLSIGDSEWFTPAGHAYIYYTDLGSTRSIHRAATGLLPGPTTFAAWQQAEFSSDASNPVLAGPAADPNHNGVANLLEYITVHQPKASNGVNPLSVSAPTPANGTVQLQFDRRRNATDVQLLLESTTDLAAGWTSRDPATLGPTITTLDDQTEHWTLTLSSNGPGQTFYRLRAQN